MDAGDKKRPNFPVNPPKSQFSKHKFAEADHTGWQDSSTRYRRNFTYVEAFLILMSLIMYLVDTLTDVLVGVQYIQDGEVYWGGATLAFVLVPAVTVQLFSFRWYVADGKTQGCRTWLVHLGLLQPLERYLYVLVAGMEARHKKTPESIDAYFYQQNDVCMLRLFEAFLESAPQLTLQMYIMMYTDSANWLTATCACVSLTALGLAVAAYGHALRQAHRDDYQICWPGLALQTMWHMAMTASRVMALVAFTSIFKAWVFLFVAIHWVFMTSWVIAQNTDFCQSQWEEVFFDCVVGFIYCYSFFNLKEGRSRWRMTAYYTLILLENLALMGLWYHFRDNDNRYNSIIMGTVIVGFFLGLCCLLLYYRLCHPSGPIHCCQTELQADSLDQKPSSVPGIPLPAAAAAQTCSTPHLSTRISAASRFSTQVSLVSKQPSSLTLSRRSLLKSHIHLHPGRPSQVQFKEVATPSQLSPIKCADQSFDPKSPIYADTTDIRLDDDVSAFQHYSVDATACLFNSRCNTLSATGVDLSKGASIDDEPSAPIKQSLLGSTGSDEGLSLPDSSDDSQIDSGTSEGVISAEDRASPFRPRAGSVHCMSCGYAPRGLGFYPQCCQSPAYKQGAAAPAKPWAREAEHSDEDSMSLSSCTDDFYSNFQNLSHLVPPQAEDTPVRETAFI